MSSADKPEVAQLWPWSRGREESKQKRRDVALHKTLQPGEKRMLRARTIAEKRAARATGDKTFSLRGLFEAISTLTDPAAVLTTPSLAKGARKSAMRLAALLRLDAVERGSGDKRKLLIRLGNADSDGETPAPDDQQLRAAEKLCQEWEADERHGRSEAVLDQGRARLAAKRAVQRAKRSEARARSPQTRPGAAGAAEVLSSDADRTKHERHEGGDRGGSATGIGGRSAESRHRPKAAAALAGGADPSGTSHGGSRRVQGFVKPQAHVALAASGVVSPSTTQAASTLPGPVGTASASAAPAGPQSRTRTATDSVRSDSESPSGAALATQVRVAADAPQALTLAQALADSDDGSDNPASRSGSDDDSSAASAASDTTGESSTEAGALAAELLPDADYPAPEAAPPELSLDDLDREQHAGLGSTAAAASEAGPVPDSPAAAAAYPAVARLPTTFVKGSELREEEGEGATAAATVSCSELGTPDAPAAAPPAGSSVGEQEDTTAEREAPHPAAPPQAPQAAAAEPGAPPRSEKEAVFEFLAARRARVAEGWWRRRQEEEEGAEARAGAAAAGSEQAAAEAAAAPAPIIVVDPALRGEWEAHTRSTGSRLMARMGYRGGALGRAGGAAVPAGAVVAMLPEGGEGGGGGRGGVMLKAALPMPEPVSSERRPERLGLGGVAPPGGAR